MKTNRPAKLSNERRLLGRREFLSTLSALGAASATGPEKRSGAVSTCPLAVTVDSAGPVTAKRRSSRPPARSRVPVRARFDQSSPPRTALPTVRSRSSIAGRLPAERGRPRAIRFCPSAEARKASRSRRRASRVRPARHWRRSSRPVPPSRRARPPGSMARSMASNRTCVPRALKVPASENGVRRLPSTRTRLRLSC